jgi:hypothetical protein
VLVCRPGLLDGAVCCVLAAKAAAAGADCSMLLPLLLPGLCRALCKRLLRTGGVALCTRGPHGMRYNVISRRRLWVCGCDK